MDQAVEAADWLLEHLNETAPANPGATWGSRNAPGNNLGSLDPTLQKSMTDNKKPHLHEAEISGTFYSHRCLWSDLLDLHRLLRERETECQGLATAALLLTYFAYEAYLNALGELVEPSVWEDARKFFSKTPHKGTPGKLDVLTHSLGVTLDKRADPYSTIRELQRRRDLLVHARTERSSRLVRTSDPATLSAPDTKYPDLSNRDFLLKARGRGGERLRSPANCCLEPKSKTKRDLW